MENQDIFSCLKMVQNSLNYSLIENLQKLQDNKIEQNFESQLCFIETFKEQIINEICQVTNLLICKLQSPKKSNKNEQLKSIKQDQQNQEQVQTKQCVHTLSKPQEQPEQQQVILLSCEEEDQSEYDIKTHQKKRKDIILKRENIQKTIYQQFLNSYDPIKRNKSQIIYYISEQTGWSVSTIQNIIRKFEFKKVNPIIYKNQTKILEFMQKSQEQGQLGKRKSLQNNDQDCDLNYLDSTGEKTSKLLNSGYSITLQTKKIIKQEYIEKSRLIDTQQ
ncbi:hypothetical protein TTHERM_00131100 (macronuclear) [Tetrahymena thermophila SB210]|uniref:Uncharacterized protein n=1 Tax=Tetrahymena thermophila (strain SB210) TaxID=312017 RepID=I7MF52_TETTS|nr:hypothetical protein TTHERM_00131100 [Tetrahymena thermophila SB210]EAR99342.2 hypothetical protein TTHERM_00131100 [Tetrahymena thermophila SB210]|eukprot:XP_001019587.2 hypothetical protein TTHERM_00131100 [Tetrahymena thermophila SB210]